MGQLFLSNGYASTSKSKPWYLIKKIDELQIFINFPKYVMSIDSVYLFHLKFMVGHLKKDPTLHLYVYERNNRVSQIRAKVIKNYLINAVGAPEKRVHILEEDLDLEYNGVKDERLRVLLTRSIFFEEGISLEPEIIGVRATKAVKPPKKPSDISFELGPSFVASNYIDEFNMYGYGLFFKLTFNSKKTLRFHVEGFSAFFEETEWEPEVRGALGFESNFEVVESYTQIYYKENFARHLFLNEFSKYQDIGIAQKFWIKALRGKSLTYKVGFLGEFSFANNLEELQNSNVLVYGIQTGLNHKSGYNIDVIYRKRRLRDVAGFGDSSEHLGLNISYTF